MNTVNVEPSWPTEASCSQPQALLCPLPGGPQPVAHLKSLPYMGPLGHGTPSQGWGWLLSNKRGKREKWERQVPLHPHMSTALPAPLVRGSGMLHSAPKTRKPSFPSQDTLVKFDLDFLSTLLMTLVLSRLRPVLSTLPLFKEWRSLY